MQGMQGIKGRRKRGRGIGPVREIEDNVVNRDSQIIVGGSKFSILRYLTSVSAMQDQILRPIDLLRMSIDLTVLKPDASFLPSSLVTLV